MLYFYWCRIRDIGFYSWNAHYIQQCNTYFIIYYDGFVCDIVREAKDSVLRYIKSPMELIRHLLYSGIEMDFVFINVHFWVLLWLLWTLLLVKFGHFNIFITHIHEHLFGFGEFFSCHHLWYYVLFLPPLQQLVIDDSRLSPLNALDIQRIKTRQLGTCCDFSKVSTSLFVFLIKYNGIFIDFLTQSMGYFTKLELQLILPRPRP